MEPVDVIRTFILGRESHQYWDDETKKIFKLRGPIIKEIKKAGYDTGLAEPSMIADALEWLWEKTE